MRLLNKLLPACLILPLLFLSAGTQAQSTNTPAAPEKPAPDYLQRQQLHQFDRHAPLPFSPQTTATTSAPAARTQPGNAAVRAPYGGPVIWLYYYPGPLVTPPPVVTPPSQPVAQAFYKQQEIYFTVVSHVEAQSANLFLRGKAYMTLDDGSQSWFQPTPDDNAEVRIENADESFLSDCAINAGNPIPPGTQLVVTGQGRYDTIQLMPDRPLWRFEITQGLRCAIDRQVLSPPAGNNTGR